MRILIVTDAARPQINGVVVTLENTIRVLKSRGHKVLVIHPYLFPTVPAPLYPEIGLPYSFRPKALQMMEDFEPDAIHIATEGPLGWFFRSLCNKKSLKFTTAYHTDFPAYFYKYFKVPKKMSKQVLKRFHNSGQRCMVSNETMAKELNDFGIPHTALWGRGVDTDVFYPTGEQEDYLLYVGRVSKEKNLEPLLELSDQYKIKVAGGGPMFCEYVKRYPNVEFLGPKKHGELAELYQRAKVFVFPSKSDTFGLVMVEAAMCGTPVAAYPVTGPVDVLANGIGAMDEDLHEAIKSAMIIDRSEVAEKARRDFSWEISTDQFESNLTLVR